MVENRETGQNVIGVICIGDEEMKNEFNLSLKWVDMQSGNSVNLKQPVNIKVWPSTLCAIGDWSAATFPILMQSQATSSIQIFTQL